jgi:hypothetical protein
MTCLFGCNKPKKNTASQTTVKKTAVATDSNVNIGSVVNLKGSECLVQVIGKDYKYLPIEQRTNDDEKNDTLSRKYGYVGMPYKQGLSDPEKFIAFDLDNIEAVIVDMSAASGGDYDLTTKFSEKPDSFGGNPIDLTPGEDARNEIIRRNATYSAASNIKSSTGIEVGVSNVTFSTDNEKDYLVFNICVKNDTKNDYVVNGKLDFQLLDNQTGVFYENDDTLINGQNLLNFKLAAGEMKNGLIAYAVPLNCEENLILKYKTDKVPETDFYITKNPNPVLDTKNVDGSSSDKKTSSKHTDSSSSEDKTKQSSNDTKTSDSSKPE